VRSEPAERKPLLYRARELSRSLEPHLATPLRIRQGKLAQVHAHYAFEGGPHDQVVPESWIGVAQIRIVTEQYQPVPLADAIEVEADDPPRRGEVVRIEVLKQLPHQKVRV